MIWTMTCQVSTKKMLRIQGLDHYLHHGLPGQHQQVAYGLGLETWFESWLTRSAAPTSSNKFLSLAHFASNVC